MVIDQAHLEAQGFLEWAERGHDGDDRQRGDQQREAVAGGKKRAIESMYNSGKQSTCKGAIIAGLFGGLTN